MTRAPFRAAGGFSGGFDLLHFDDSDLVAAEREVVAANGDLERIAERSDIDYFDFRAARKSERKQLRPVHRIADGVAGYLRDVAGFKFCHCHDFLTFNCLR